MKSLPKETNSFSTLREGLEKLLCTGAENGSKQRGQWELFEWSRGLPGFGESEVVWKRMFVESIGRLGGMKSVADGDGVGQVEELFFLQMFGNPQLALQKNAELVRRRAAEGDIRFLDRLAASHANSKRRGASKRHQLQFDILMHWLHGFLWLMDTKWGSSHLDRSLGRPVSEGAYIQCLRRLGLSPVVLPLVVGLKKDGSFIWRDGLGPPQQIGCRTPITPP